MKLVHPCLSIDWRAFDLDFLMPQRKIGVQGRSSETSSFPGSPQAWEKIAQHSIADIASDDFALKKSRPITPVLSLSSLYHN